MRISDWSSDVCSSDLAADENAQRQRNVDEAQWAGAQVEPMQANEAAADPQQPGNRRLDARRRVARRLLPHRPAHERKSVGEGKRVAVRVDLGGRRIIKKKNTEIYTKHTLNAKQ